MREELSTYLSTMISLPVFVAVRAILIPAVYSQPDQTMAHLANWHYWPLTRNNYTGKPGQSSLTITILLFTLGARETAFLHLLHLLSPHPFFPVRINLIDKSNNNLNLVQIIQQPSQPQSSRASRKFKRLQAPTIESTLCF